MVSSSKVDTYKCITTEQGWLNKLAHKSEAKSFLASRESVLVAAVAIPCVNTLTQICKFGTEFWPWGSSHFSGCGISPLVSKVAHVL